MAPAVSSYISVGQEVFVSNLRLPSFQTSKQANLINLLFMRMSDFSTSMLVYHVHGWCPLRPEESVRFPGTGVADRCELPFELEIESLISGRAASILSCTVMSLAPSIVFFFFNSNFKLLWVSFVLEKVMI